MNDQSASTTSRFFGTPLRASVTVYLAALILRLLYLATVSHVPYLLSPLMDEKYHLELAQGILDHGFFGTEPYFRAPLYPFLLALFVSVLGDHLMLIRLLQAVIGSFTPVLTYLIGMKFFDRKIAIIAGFVAACYPTLWYYDVSLLITSIMVLLVTCVVLGLKVAEDDPRLKRFVVAGLLIGLTALARPNILIILPLLLVWIVILWKGDKPLKKPFALYTALVLAVILIIAPITIRNAATGEGFVPISWQGGFNFFLGNNSQANGWSATAPGIDKTWQGGYNAAIQIPRVETGVELNRAATDRYWWKRTFATIDAHPGHFVRLLAYKFALFWNGYEIPNNLNIYFIRDFSFLAEFTMANGVVRFPFGILAPLALLGIGLSLARWRRYILLYIATGGYMLSVILFFVCARFRQPLVPLLILLAVFATAEMIRFLRERRTGHFVLMIVILVALGAGSNINLIRQSERGQRAFDYYTLGIAEQQREKISEAVTAYEKSIHIDSTFSPSLAKLGMFNLQWQNDSIGVTLLYKALRYDSTNALAWSNLARYYTNIGSLPEAMYFIHKAVDMEPYNDEYYFQMGYIYHLWGDPEAAIVAYAGALRLNPQNKKALTNRDQILNFLQSQADSQ
jgi:4-amino-4-deoxy-L-arabinose transferase-like glycosyltransferase